jgi:hypothetical protein
MTLFSRDCVLIVLMCLLAIRLLCIRSWVESVETVCVMYAGCLPKLWRFETIDGDVNLLLELIGRARKHV